MQGWIKLHRKLQTHWLYSEKRSFSQLEAWIDILMTVNHKENKISIKGKIYEVKRGESLNSLDTWARRWNWHKSKVRRFLVLLQNDNMIAFKSETKSTRITICNYDSYQETRNETESEMKRLRNASETLATPNKNVKNNKNANNEKDADQNADNNHVFIQITKDNMWIEAMCMNHRTDPEILIGHLRKFYWHCLSNDNFKSNTSDAKKHFNNWINRENPVPKRKLTATFEGFE